MCKGRDVPVNHGFIQAFVLGAGPSLSPSQAYASWLKGSSQVYLHQSSKFVASAMQSTTCAISALMISSHAGLSNFVN